MWEHSRCQTSRRLPHGRTDDVFAVPVAGKQAGSSPGNPIRAGAEQPESSEMALVPLRQIALAVDELWLSEL